jgi:hypothetical protein
MAVYGPACHQKNIIWTSYFFGDGPVHIPQCHELFAIYIYITQQLRHSTLIAVLHFTFILRWYYTLQGDNSLKSVESFDHMMFVCRFQASLIKATERKAAMWLVNS